MEVKIISELVATLLKKRGVSTPDAMERFLVPDYARDTHSPLLLEGMDRAVTRIFAAMTQGERIGIYADFDCDGIPGAAVLYDTFAKIGYENIEVYIPHRDMEGYGVHVDALKALKQKGVSLVITVDVGTVALEPVRIAKELGIDVIITDHHEPGSVLPDAVAVLNPKLPSTGSTSSPQASSGQAAYPFRELCGAAVAWKLSCALFAEGKKRALPQFAGIPDGWEKWLLDLVAIATIADMVPLVGENRALTHFGLRVLRKSTRPGLRALSAQLRLRQNELTEDDVSFSFAPRINAASRMGDPETAFKLLVTKDAKEAETLAIHLEELNASRKGAVGSIVREAKKRIGVRFSATDPVVVLGDTAWKPALLGLVANTFVKERGGVVCMWGRDGNGALKGSCRSDGSVSVVELFSKTSGALQEYGGHAGSGGFSVSHESVHTLFESLAAAHAQLAAAPPSTGPEGPLRPSNGSNVEGLAVTKHDVIVTISEISWPLFRELSLLSPFGIGNPKPVFRIPRATITSIKTFGKEKNHCEVTLSSSASNASTRAFDFFRSPASFSALPVVGMEADVLATLIHDTFRGQNSLALRLVDIISAT